MNSIIFKNKDGDGYLIKINEQFINIIIKDGIPCISKEQLSLAIDGSVLDKTCFGKIIFGRNYDDRLLPVNEIEHTLENIDETNKSQRGTIYLISDGEYTKIGMTDKNIEKRLASLQTGNAKELKILGTYKTKNRYAEEKRLHNIFKSQHIRGEWFELSHSDIKMILLYEDAIYKEKKSYFLTKEELDNLYSGVYTIMFEEYRKSYKKIEKLFEEYFDFVFNEKIIFKNSDSTLLKEIYEKHNLHQNKDETFKRSLYFDKKNNFLTKYNKHNELLKALTSIGKKIIKEAI